MERYQIILAYDGTGLAGSQRQANTRTAQSELEAALRRLGWQGNSVLMAGRTDSGVHASGQVAAFDLEWKHPLAELVRALNSQLPGDVAVQSAKIAASDFHPRFAATSRCYRYRLFCQSIRDPLRERYAWGPWPTLVFAALESAARFLIGRHDFAAFGTPPRVGSSTVRTVMEAEWQNAGDEWTFIVRADAFLYRMVRRMVFLQTAVGLGKIPAERIADLLENSTRVVPAGLAPANGLTLVEVTYPG